MNRTNDTTLDLKEVVTVLNSLLTCRDTEESTNPGQERLYERLRLLAAQAGCKRSGNGWWYVPQAVWALEANQGAYA